ncbi:hypothetical protein FD724_34220 (plasmid) [Nostoc sp. C057]|uniref:hypothetical protein n=1 Tax=Nostoc sp. C057 TaxID=2576903 RepID=UPI001C4DD773|nr:hypothetical protein [Nostoc sp. C057]QLE53011.1 hypothetical protein FD724_34220 [Nostoc sp. C057]
MLVVSGLGDVLWTVYYATIPIPTLRDAPLKSYCELLSIAKYVHLGAMPNSQSAMPAAGVVIAVVGQIIKKIPCVKRGSKASSPL